METGMKDFDADFRDRTATVSIDTSGWNTSSLERCWAFVRDCPNLASADLSGLDTRKVHYNPYYVDTTGNNWTNTIAILINCPKLTTFSIGANFQKANSEHESLKPLQVDGNWKDSSGTVFTASTIPLGKAERYTKVS